MTTTEAPRAPVLIPFVCPICAGSNAVELIILSRAGGMSCQQCGKHLRSTDVMRAMHSPRSPPTSERRIPVREAVPKKQEMVWPPTAESRAAIAPLRRRNTHGERN